MPRTETPARDTQERKPNSGLFQRLGKNKTESSQEQPKPRKKLSDMFKNANTPREKEVAEKHDEVKEETRGLLGNLRENMGIEKRQQIRELQKTVAKNPDISKDKAAVTAYQELIKLTDPERFAREIGKVDGVYGPKTRKAYEVDKTTLEEPRTAVLTALSSNTPKEDISKKPKFYNISFSGDNAKSGIMGGGKYTSASAYSEDGVTQCAGTARQNLERFGINNAPRSSALGVFQKYKNGERGNNMINFVPGKFTPPAGATVADILIDTPQLKHYGADFGHRAVAYKDKGWYVLDPYFNGTNQSVPLKTYLSKFQGKQGYGLRGVAFYEKDLSSVA